MPKNEEPFYIEISKQDTLKIEKSIKKDITDNSDINQFTITFGNKKEKIRYQFYKLDSDSIINIDYLNLSNEEIIYSEEVPKMKWEILNETKYISQYLCTKASLDFRGRKYFAWFTSEIPIRFGPWKFLNAPGLILHIEDSDRLFIWSVSKISLKEVVYKPQNNNPKKSMSIKEFIRIKENNDLEVANQAILKAKNRMQSYKSKIVRGRELKFEWEN